MTQLSTPYRASGILALCGLVSSAQAALITLPGLGFDVVYDDQVLTLGQSAPVILGNTVVFTPNQLKAESLNGQGAITATSTYSFVITPHDGLSVQTISIMERGDYVLRGAGSSVTSWGSATATALGQPTNHTVTQALVLDPGLPMTVNDGLSHNWAATGLLDLSGQSAFMSEADVQFSLDTTLLASTSAGSGPRRAFIQKKFSGESITLSVATTPVVPEPATLALLLAGLGLSAWWGRSAHRVG